MTPPSPLLYLNATDLDALGLSTGGIVDVLEAVFRHKAAGDTRMPPKIFFHFGEDRFYSAMASSCPPLGYAGCKWQAGDPANPARGLPYIQGLYILNDHASGEMLAIMDAKWITGRRTAAASALVARYQAPPGAATLAILGCGVQGRAHLEALSGEVPSLRLCRAYDVVPQRQADYVAEMDARHGAVRVRGAAGAREACADADIIVTGGPIRHHRTPTLEPGWIKPGALVVTIDYDSYVTDACIAAMDLVITDDREQIADARRNEGKFPGVTRIDADLSELIAAGKGRRTGGGQRVMAFNLGIALEDVATAAHCLRLARERAVGTALAP